MTAVDEFQERRGSENQGASGEQLGALKALNTEAAAWWCAYCVRVSWGKQGAGTAVRAAANNVM
jgi:hypothetical protein